MKIIDSEKEEFCVRYNPVMKKYYLESRSRGITVVYRKIGKSNV
jgi:hypothetical protein